MHTYTVAGRAMTLARDCWALLFDEGVARECRVLDPRADSEGRVRIDVSGSVGGRISHSYCPECSDAFLAEICQERAHAASVSHPAFEAN